MISIQWIVLLSIIEVVFISASVSTVSTVSISDSIQSTDRVEEGDEMMKSTIQIALVYAVLKSFRRREKVN